MFTEVKGSSIHWYECSLGILWSPVCCLKWQSHASIAFTYLPQSKAAMWYLVFFLAKQSHTRQAAVLKCGLEETCHTSNFPDLTSRDLPCFKIWTQDFTTDAIEHRSKTCYLAKSKKLSSSNIPSYTIITAQQQQHNYLYCSPYWETEGVSQNNHQFVSQCLYAN